MPPAKFEDKDPLGTVPLETAPGLDLLTANDSVHCVSFNGVVSYASFLFLFTFQLLLIRKIIKFSFPPFLIESYIIVVIPPELINSNNPITSFNKQENIIEGSEKNYSKY